MNKISDAKANYNSIEGIAIIGMAGRFPEANDIQSFWQNLQDGVESLSLFTDEELIAAGVSPTLVNDRNYVKVSGVLENIDLFDAAFFDLNPKETELIDPQHRLFLECAWSAMENAGYDSSKCDSRIGVYAGASLNNYLSFDLNDDQLGSGKSYQKMIGNDKGFLSTRVSYQLNLTGPSITVQTACSTSLVATTLAYQSLQNYQCDMALAGGVSVRVPQKTGYFYEPGGPLSPDGHCHAFDAQARGTTIGNGVGVVVLKRVQDAIADGDCIYAVIKGAAINNDGAMKVGYTAPSVDGQADAIAEAVMLAEIEPETIDYIEAHGSGTALGDPIEIAALSKVFRASTEQKNFCAIGSVKTNIGHLDAAAGVAGLIKTALSLKHRLIPPSLNFEQPNPQIDFANSPFYVNTQLQEWQSGSSPRRAGVSSLGMGGTNAHLVLEEAPTLPVSSSSRPWQLLLLSAKTESALETATQNLSQHLELHPDLNLADVAYTLQLGRRDFNHRRILVCVDTQAAIDTLNQPASQRVSTRLLDSATPSVTFVFPGEDELNIQTGRELYETEPVFRQHLEQCCLILEPYLGLNLRDLIYADAEVEKLQQTGLTRCAVFVIEYALAKLWMSWGISPQAMIGRGIGEYVAATLAGVFALEDVLVLVAKGFDPELLATVQLHPPTIPLISGVSGTWMTQAEAIDPNYWGQPAVGFGKGIGELAQDEGRILLEIGSGNLNTEEFNQLRVLTSIPCSSEQDSEQAFLLNTLGQLWMSGIEVDWSSFYANEHRHRLPLPTYPFERQRYWLESTVSEESSLSDSVSNSSANRRYSMELDSSSAPELQTLEKKPDLADWFYIPVWKQSLPLEFFQSQEATELKLNCLVFADSYGVGAEFTKSLKQQGHDAITVRLGTQFSKLDNRTYIINPQQSDDYDLLLQELQKQDFQPKAIAHFWSLTQSEVLLNNAESLNNSRHLGFDSLLLLTQAIGKQDIWDSLRLMVVTNNLYDVIGDENLAPQKATLLGPCKVIPKEYPNINCSLIDLGINATSTPLSSQTVDNLLAELTLPQTNEIVAYRRHHRWIQTFDSVSLDDRISSKTKLREGGVYLITGGLGGIGLVLAEHLAKTVRAKLILIGRGKLPKPSDWSEWLATHDEQDSVSRKIQKVRSLEELGAEVEIQSADVTNREQMQSAIAQSIERFGQINGVIHAAGIAGGGVTQLKTREMASSVLAPKVQGTLILEEVLQNVNLDFLVLCSSKTSVLGEFGQIDYCGANAFLDAYALSHTSTSERSTVSISWDTWQEVGLAVETVLPDKIKQERAAMIKKGMLPEEGVNVFNRILGTKLPHVVVSTQDLPALIEQHNSSEYLSQQLKLIEDNLSSVNLSKAKHPRPNLGNDYVTPQTEIERLLADIWQEILGIDRIGVYDNFFELGGNSINTIQIAAKASQVGLELTSEQFFHYQTIAELAADLGITPAMTSGNDVPKTFALTPTQQHFFALNQQDPHRHSQSLLLEIKQVCNPDLLEQALQHLVRHHDVFRLRFIQQDSDWQQIYTDDHNPIELRRIDLSSQSATEQQHSLASAAALEASLNLGDRSLVRFSYINLGAQQNSYLLIVIHDLIVDSESWQILLEDLQTAYQQIHQDRAIHLPDTTPYIQWTQFLQKYAQSPAMMREQDYWLREMQKPFSSLPVDYLTSDRTAANADMISVSLSKAETKSVLEEIHQAYNTQIEDVLLTALVQAFTDWTGEAKLRLDIRGNSKESFKEIDISRTVGSFTTHFPAVLDIAKSDKPGDGLIAVKEYLRNVPTRGTGYNILQYSNNQPEMGGNFQQRDSSRRGNLAESRAQTTPAQSEVSFSYLGQGDRPFSQSSLFDLPDDSPRITHSKSANQTYLLEIEVIIVREQLQLNWQYSQAVYNRETIENLANSFVDKIRSLIVHTQSVETAIFTPSDFSRAKLNQQQLDSLLQKISPSN